MARKQLGVAPVNTTDAATKGYVDPQITSTATAAGTTTLTVTSTPVQVLTGTTTQTVVLPTTSVSASWQTLIMNQSTGIVTVNASGGATVILLAPDTSAMLTAAVATPTLPINWDCQYGGVAVTSGKLLQIANSLSVAAFDGAAFNLGGTPTTLTSAVATSGTTQTVIASYAIPANALVAGMAFQFELFGFQTSVASVTYYVCLGSAGTNADAAMLTTASTSIGTGAGGTLEGILTIRSTGSSGTCIASGVSIMGTTTALANNSSPTTINTTGQLYLTIQCKAAASVHTIEQAFLSVCQV